MTEASQTERETGTAGERYVILSNPNQAAVIDTFTNAALFTYTGPNRLMRALDRHMRLTERWEALEEAAAMAAPRLGLTPEESVSLAASADATDDGRIATPAEDMTVTQPIPAPPKVYPPGRLNGAPHAAGASVKNLGPFDPREYGLPAVPRPDRVTRLTAMLAQVIEVEARLWELLAEDTRELNRAVSLRKRFERDIREAATTLSATERAERSPLVPVSTPETFEVGESVLWGSWNGPRPGRIVAGPAELGGAYYVEVEAKRSHPCLGSFKGWIPAAELHRVER